MNGSVVHVLHDVGGVECRINIPVPQLPLRNVNTAVHSTMSCMMRYMYSIMSMMCVSVGLPVPVPVLVPKCFLSHLLPASHFTAERTTNDDCVGKENAPAADDLLYDDLGGLKSC